MKLTSAIVTATLAIGACDKRADLDAEPGAAPPPIASAKSGLCQGGGGKSSDAVSAAFFPRKVAGFCLDPNAETRAYGAQTSEPIDQVCLEQFNGECELYKSYGLERVVTLRYVDGEGSDGSVTVTLSRFTTAEGAYGFFTRRIVGDEDPARLGSEKLVAGGVGALGAGSANVWRSRHVAELRYTNAQEPGERVVQLARGILPALSQRIGEQLPGDKSLPPAARALPSAHRLRLGIVHHTKDVLGIAGTGPGAVGYYQKGDQRWRVVSIVREDEDSARDVMKTLKREAGAKSLKGTTPPALALVQPAEDDGPKIEWIVARSGRAVFGVGDEAHALTPDRPAAAVAKSRLDQTGKLERIRQLLASPAPAGSARNQDPAKPSAE